MHLENFAAQLVSQTVTPSRPTLIEPQPSTTAANTPSFLSNIDWLAIGVLLFLLVILGVVIYLTLKYLKNKDRDEKAKDWSLFEIMVPRENEIEVGVAEQMFANLSGIGGGGKGFLAKYTTIKYAISFEMVGLPDSIRFYIYCPRKLASWVEKQVLGSYQDANFVEAPEYNIFPADGRVAFANLVLTDESYYPLKTSGDMEGDSMANITSSLSKVRDGEGIAVQLVISPTAGKWQKSGRKFVTRVEQNNADPEKKKISVSQDQLQAVSKKCAKVGFGCALRIVAVAKDDDTAKMHLNNVVGAFDQFSNPGINELKRDKVSPFMEREFVKDFIYRHPAAKNSLVLNVEELAAMYHFPNKNVQTPNIHWLLWRDAPADPIVATEGTWLGKSKFRGEERDVYIKPKDRMRHVYVVGQTGSGKSYMLQNMAIQDAYAGKGFIAIDPHGSMTEYILERIPHERAEDVIYFNPADYERPLGFNIMEFYNEQDKHRIVNGFIGFLQKMFDPNQQGMTGPIFEQAVRNAMLTAMSKKGSTLVEVVRILTDNKWVTEEWLPLIKDDMVRRYWTDQIAKTSDFHKSETLGYIVSKFDRFVTNIAIRNIIGQSESSFNIRKIMDEKKILIVTLSKGLIGEENAQFLGLLLIPRILAAALSREDITEEQREDFFLYVDEFQNFATPDFAQILSEARKYKLSLNVGNQYIGQMQEEVRNAVFGNVGTIMAYRVGPDDGKYLASHYEPTFTESDLINQPNIHACVKLLVDGKYPAPFSVDPFYDDTKYPKYPEVTQLIKKLSRLKYGRDRATVENEISKRAQLAASGANEKKVPAPPALPFR